MCPTRPSAASRRMVASSHARASSLEPRSSRASPRDSRSASAYSRATRRAMQPTTRPSPRRGTPSRAWRPCSRPRATRPRRRRSRTSWKRRGGAAVHCRRGAWWWTSEMAPTTARLPSGGAARTRLWSVARMAVSSKAQASRSSLAREGWTRASVDSTARASRAAPRGSPPTSVCTPSTGTATLAARARRRRGRRPAASRCYSCLWPRSEPHRREASLGAPTPSSRAPMP